MDYNPSQGGTHSMHDNDVRSSLLSLYNTWLYTIYLECKVGYSEWSIEKEHIVSL